MNRAYLTVYNATLGAWVAVPENAKRCGKTKAAAAVAAVVLALPAPSVYALDANALPSGGQVSAGSGSVAGQGNTLTVSQASQKLAIDWQSFNVGSAATVNFVQPSASAVALNRVVGGDKSEIYGHLNANGQVFLLNANGILFGKTAQVNVGGLVASTLNLSDADFMKGNYRFTGSAGSVANQGAIATPDGGYVALLGGQVSNEGTISARLGYITLAAGNEMTLDFAGDGLIGVTVNQGTLNALAENKQLIQADGGSVLMVARAADSLIQAAVNNEGVIEAHRIENKGGTIKLLGDPANGAVKVGGTLDASAPDGGDGGFIETSAAQVKVADGARITTLSAQGANGTWLIDPTDFAITAGSAAQTTSGIGAATLESALAAGNVTLATDNSTGTDSGDIKVNAAVNWSANTLTLNAYRDVDINAVMSATGSAGLALNPNQGGSGGTVNAALNGNGFTGRVDFSSAGALSINGVAYTVINDMAALQAMGANLAGHYALGSNLDASGVSGFTPIGNGTSAFAGTFNGLGHVIDRLTINLPGSDYVGLFGSLNTPALSNLGLTAANIAGNNNVGVLAGWNGTSTIHNNFSTGTVHGGNAKVGGLVGGGGGVITDSYSSANVSAAIYAGGLVGMGSATIDGCFASGAVSTVSAGGGLVGYNVGIVRNSYATGAVVSSDVGGGLVGNNAGGTISNSYASGTVSPSGFFGGLVGFNGGQWGTPLGTVTASYWNVATSGLNSSAGGAGLTATEMTNAGSFAGWDIATGGGSTSVWRIYGGSTAPLLRRLLTPLTVTANSGTREYDGSSAGLGVTYSVTPGSHLLGTATVAAAGKNVGLWTVSASGLHSDQQGYDITLVNGTLDITAKRLTVTGATVANKVYDGTTNAVVTGGAVPGVVSGEVVTLSQNGAFADKNIGIGKTVNEAFSLGGADAGNYVLTNASVTTTADITPATLTVTANNASKIYNGLAWRGGNGVVLSGFVAGEDASALTGSIAYGGSAQGAVGVGRYAIAVGGLAATNYGLRFVDGVLNINPNDGYQMAIDSTQQQTAAVDGVSAGSAAKRWDQGGIAQHVSLLTGQLDATDDSLIDVVGGGVRLPDNM